MTATEISVGAVRGSAPDSCSGSVDVGGEADVYLPLRDHTGRVIAYTIIDASMAVELGRWRWSLSDRGYAVRSVRVGNGRQRKLRLHRVVMGCNPGDKREIDHLNRNKLDNRRSNLTFATRAQNNRNKDPRTECRNGHPRISANVYLRGNGHVTCMACQRLRRRERA